MSHIQGQPHPAGATEHLDYAMAHLDNIGLLTHIVVVTHHSVSGIHLGSQTTTYHYAAQAGQRSLTAILTATKRNNLQAALTDLLTAVTATDTPNDPAPPIPFR